MNIIYTRQSLLKEDSLSLSDQEDKCKALLDKNEEYILYSDAGISGKSIDRPSFNKVIELIKEDKVDKLLVYRLDRCTRSIRDFATLVELFKNHNVIFISASENINLSTAAGKMLASLLAVFAEFERESIQQRITDSYYKRLSDGVFPGFKPPLGFNTKKVNIDGKNLTTIETNNDIEIVKELFNRYSIGNISLRKVALYLNKEYKTKFDSSMISKYLRNPIYVKCNIDIYNYYKNKGLMIKNDIEDFTGYNGALIIGTRKSDRSYSKLSERSLYLSYHKGVIDSDLFLKVQYKLENNKQLKRTNSGKSTWLINVKCAKCGHSLGLTTNKIGVSYYRCKYKDNTNQCEGLSTIRVNEVEEVVSEYIIKKLKSLKNEELIIENTNNDKINKLKIEISKIDSDIEKLVEKIPYATEKTMSYINRNIEDFENKRNELINTISKLKTKNMDVSLKDLIESNIEFNKLNLDKKRNICLSLIDKIIINDDEIEIIWLI